MTEEIGTSNLLRTWANDGTVVVPSNAKIDEGWLRGEQPPHEWMNYIHNVLGQKINHALSQGAAAWNSTDEQPAGCVKTHNGDLWLALSTNTNSAPSAGNSNWARIVDQSKDANINSLTIGRGEGGIGTNTAIGTLALSSNTTGGDNTAIGNSALRDNTTGDENTAVGREALRDNTTASDNTAVGRSALQDNTTGVRNTALGREALSSNTTGGDNTAVGRLALRNNTTGDNNTALGREALRDNTTGVENTAVGRFALRDNTTGDLNTAVGLFALFRNTTGSSNAAVGPSALSSNTTGTGNTAVGREALRDNTTASDNTAVGRLALQDNTTGVRNTALGREALRDNTTASDNTAVGRSALSNNTTGDANTALGRLALQDNTTGVNNIGIGFEAGRAGSPFTITSQNNRIVMGNNDHTDAYIRIAWTVTSDARDKDNFAPVPHGLDFINALQPTEYQLKAGGRDGVGDGRRRYGFLAQDVLEAEGESPVIVDAEDPENLKLHESYIVPVLVNAIKELTAQVEALQSEVNALKGE